MFIKLLITLMIVEMGFTAIACIIEMMARKKTEGKIKSEIKKFNL